VQDTLTGTLHYAGERVALGTMVYKQERACGDLDLCKKALEKTQVHLKLTPCVTGHSKIEQMVACNLSQIRLKDFWIAPARLNLTRYVNAPDADLPVKRVIGGKHSAPISPCPMAGSCTTILTEAPT
jgi:acetoacetate decarboxylase